MVHQVHYRRMVSILTMQDSSLLDVKIFRYSVDNVVGVFL